MAPLIDGALAHLMDVSVLGNPLSAWLLGLASALATVLAVRLLRRLLQGQAAALAARTRTTLDDLALRLLSGTRVVFVLLLAVWIGSQSVVVSERVERVLGVLLILGVAIQAGLWGGVALDHVIGRYRERLRTRDAGAATTLAALGFAARLVLWSLLLLLALDNLGVDVTAMVAGLGIGGIAVALAVQNILSDLFASVSIIVDRPFVVGDFIIVDDYLGTVERVGLKTTHVRSLGGEQIVFPNNDLLKTRVRNYKRMFERRVVFTFGVDYATEPQQLRDLAEFLRDTVSGTARVRLERAHFFRFGESSLDFEVAYWVQDPDYGVYMDIQQDLNLRIMAAVAERGIRFAHPMRRLRLESPVRVAALDPADEARLAGVPLPPGAEGRLRSAMS